MSDPFALANCAQPDLENSDEKEMNPENVTLVISDPFPSPTPSRQKRTNSHLRPLHVAGG